MKKAVFIAMAALVLLTAQCKKNEPKPEEKVMVPITGTVDFGGGSKTEITTAGYITPVAGDKIYIYNAGTNVGSMTCTAVSGQQFECSGEIEEDCLGKTCTFMYLGTGSTEADGTTDISKTSTTISFANQTVVSVVDGKISGLDKFHVGSCIADVSETGTVTLPMLSKMAIAYFKLTTDDNNPIADQDITISGLPATATINKADGTLTGSGSGDITVHTGEDGSFYMALIPHSGSVTFTFKGSGYNDATTTFANGIRPCCFYSEQGLGNPLQVTMEIKPTPTYKFSVSSITTVEFAPGNLYWNGSAFRFETNQWSFASTWDESHVNLFFWSKDARVGYAADYDEANSRYGITPITSDVFFTNDTETTANPDFHVNGETGDNTWRTLSYAEWSYLLNSRINAESLRAWKELDSGAHKGLVILPDGTDAGVMYKIATTADLANYGAVFLPAAGYRQGTTVNNAATEGYYWMPLCLGNCADCLLLNNDWFFEDIYLDEPNLLYMGCSVRLVR